MKKSAVGILKKLNQSSAESVPVEKYLTFYIENQLYAIPSSQVMEIIRMQPITFMPNMPPFVKGIINLRGKIVPLIDLCMKFGKPDSEYNDRTSIVVVDAEDFNVGLIVEAVNDVTDIAENQITDSPALSKGNVNRYVCGIATLENEVAMLLDLMKVLKEDTNGTFGVEDADKANTEKADKK